MFSSFGQSFSQLSPKKLLANYLSTQLAEYFDCDANTIETNLVSDAHIKLQNIRIHPYVLESDKNDILPLVCEGWVDSFEFSWKWGTGFGEGAKAYIKDVQLKIQGVKLRVYATANPPPGSKKAVTSTDATATKAPEKSAGDTDWKARYLQQILDHLTLMMGSLEITIELPDQEGSPRRTLYVVAKQAELITLGGSTAAAAAGGLDNALRQRLSLGSLSAIIRQMDPSGGPVQESPLLDPVGYRAVIKRVSGRRFIDGIGAGLVITGERILSGMGTGSAGVVGNALQVHAGIAQVSCLLQLQKMFGFDDQSAASPIDAPEETPVEENKSSLFILPVDHMALILENGANLRINQCVVTLRTDGSVCRVECPNGSIWVDGQPINHTEAGHWQVDLLRSLISVDTRSNSVQDGDSETFFDAAQGDLELLTRLELHIDQCRKVYRGLNEIMPLFDDSDSEEAVTPWTFEINGNAGITIVSSNGTKARANLSRPWLRYIGTTTRDTGGLPGLPCLYSWNSITVDSPDLGNLSAFIPKVDASPDGLALAFSEAATSSTESADSAQSAIDFVNEVLDIFEGESTGVPVKVTMPTVVLRIANEEMDIELEKVTAAGFVVTIANTEVSSRHGYLSAGAVRCDTALNTVDVDRLSCSSSDESIILAKPLENVQARYVEDRLVLEAGLAEVIIRQSSESKSEPTSPWDISVPMGVDLSLEGLTVCQDEASHVLLDLKLLRVNAGQIHGQSKADFAWEYIKYQDFELTKGSGQFQLSKTCLQTSIYVSCIRSMAWPVGTARSKDVKIKGKLQPDNPSGEALAVNGIGFVDEMCVSVGSIEELSMDQVFSLTEPVSDTKFTIKRGKIVVETGKISVLLPQSPDSMTQDGGIASLPTNVKFPLSVDFFVPVVILYGGAVTNKLLETRVCSARAKSVGDNTEIDISWKSLEAMDFDLCGGKARSSLEDGQFDCSIAIESVRSIVRPEGKVSAKRVQVKGVLEPTMSSPNSFNIKGVGFLPTFTLSVEELSSLSLTGFAELAAPVTTCSVEFSDGICAVQLGELNFVLEIPPNESVSPGSPSFETPSLSFPVVCSLTSLKARQHTAVFHELRVAGAFIELTPDGSSTSGKLSCTQCSIDHVGLLGNGVVATVFMSQSRVQGTISCDSVGATKFRGVDLSMNSLQASVDVGVKSVRSPLDDGLWLDGVGAVTAATASISEINSLAVDGIGCLVSPLTGTTASFREGLVELCTGDIHFCQFESSLSVEAPARGDFTAESFLANVTLPFRVKSTIPSAKVYIPDQINPVFEWEQLSFGCSTMSPNTTGNLTWIKSCLYGVHLGSTDIDVSVEGSQVRSKATVSTASLDDSADISFSAKNMTAAVTVETSSQKNLVGFPIEYLGCVTEMETSVDEVNSLYVKGSGTLLAPLQKTEFSFRAGTSRINLEQVYWHDLSVNQGQSNEASEYSDVAAMFRFPLDICVKSARIDNDPFNSAYNSKQSTFGFKNFLCELGAVHPPSTLVPFTISRVEEIWYLQMVKVPSLRLRGVVDLRKPDCVRNLDLDIPTLYLSADFSARNWASAVSHETTPPLPLPHAHISELDLILSGKGKLFGMKSSTLHCKAFSGSETTDSDKLSKQYITIVKKRIPYLLSNAEILGANVGDSLGMTAASMAVKSTVVGSVAGVGARDAVGGAISLGKQSRGASETERYHFGDFSRGVLAGTRLASKKGSSMRGSDKYGVGDFTMGASSAAGDYTSKNRDRLGGAAGSGAAMVAGAAIAGPVGLVAGAIVGGMAGRKVVKATVGEYKGGTGSTSTPEAIDQASSGSCASGAASTVAQLRNNRPQTGTTTQNQAHEGVDLSSDIESEGRGPPSQQNTAANDDPLGVFVCRDTPQPQQTATTTTSSHHANSGELDPFSVFEAPQPRQTATTTTQSHQVNLRARDPFSVFETPVPAQPAQTYEVPPSDPLSGSSLQGTQVNTTQSHSATYANQQSPAIPQQPAFSYGQTGNPAAAPYQGRQMNPTYLAQQTRQATPPGSFPGQLQQQGSRMQPRASPVPQGTPTQQRGSPGNSGAGTFTTQAQHRHHQQHQQQMAQQQRAAAPQAGQGQRPQQQGYKFGDITRGLIAKAKHKKGGDGSSSKWF